jgi:hypothetical protein
MKAKILILLVITFIVNACSKNADSVKPELSFGSVNGTTFRLNTTIAFVLTLKSAITGSTKDTLFIARKFFTCPFITTDTTFYPIPEYNGIKNQKATIEYTFQYGAGGKFNGCINNAGSASRTDSLNYFFWVKDSNGNTSDTIKSPKIILLR